MACGVCGQIFGLPIKQVVSPSSGELAELEEAFTGEGVAVNSGALIDGKSTAEAKKAVMAELDKRGKGGSQTTFKLRDWVFSRCVGEGGRW